MRAGRLDGKVALITGTGGGQGRAAAQLFAAEGAVVVGCDLSEAAAAETAELVRASGGTIDSTEPLDLADADAAASWIDDAARDHGRIDVVYNNAAAARGSAFGELSYADWAFTLRNELDLIFHVCRAAWPHLAEGGGGSIVNTASTAGVVGSPVSNAAHAAGKGGVIALTRQLAAEGGPYGIRANCVTPGSIATGAGSRLADDERFMRSYAAQTPLRRLGVADDIAYAALYFASDESSFVTGQNLVVDGGRTSTGFVFCEDGA